MALYMRCLPPTTEFLAEFDALCDPALGPSGIPTTSKAAPATVQSTQHGEARAHVPRPQVDGAALMVPRARILRRASSASGSVVPRTPIMYVPPISVFSPLLTSRRTDDRGPPAGARRQASARARSWLCK
jgi:hypothetical protein